MKRKVWMFIASQICFFIAGGCAIAVVATFGAAEWYPISALHIVSQAGLFAVLTWIFGKIGFALYEAI